MKMNLFRISKYSWLFLLCLSFCLSNFVRASEGVYDISVTSSDISYDFSRTLFVPGDKIRIYALIHNNGETDVRGRVNFYLYDINSNIEQKIGESQYISFKANGFDEQVFINWIVPKYPFRIGVESIMDEFSDLHINNNKAYSANIIPYSDNDGDSIADIKDEDDDNDGASDEEEKRRGWDAKNPDTDGDYFLDSVDNCPLNSNINQLDTDGDHIGDICDEDDDNDGLKDSEELVYGSDPLNKDSDGDQINDLSDNCLLIANKDQHDFDRDGKGDICDEDDDNDGLKDNEEYKRGLDSMNKDIDGDGILDGEEIKIKTDPKIKDTDQDGIADGNEFKFGTNPLISDSDGDLVVDGLDNCPLVINSGQSDKDHDGKGDKCDNFDNRQSINVKKLSVNKGLDNQKKIISDDAKLNVKIEEKQIDEETQEEKILIGREYFPKYLSGGFSEISNLGNHDHSNESGGFENKNNSNNQFSNFFTSFWELPFFSFEYFANQLLAGLMVFLLSLIGILLKSLFEELKKEQEVYKIESEWEDDF